MRIAFRLQVLGTSCIDHQTREGSWVALSGLIVVDAVCSMAADAGGPLSLTAMYAAMG